MGKETNHLGKVPLRIMLMERFRIADELIKRLKYFLNNDIGDEMKINKKVIMLLVLTLILLITSILLINKINDISGQITEENDSFTKTKAQLDLAEGILYGYTKDTNYKMFFGEWEVTKAINITSTENDNNIIGDMFYYDYDVIKRNSEIITETPIYMYYIIPEEDSNPFYEQPSPKELGINGPYSVRIKVNNDYFDGAEFYVKDDQTLILITLNGAFYEMKRIKYFNK